MDGDRNPPCDGDAVERRLRRRAGQRDDGIGMEFQRRARQRAFKAGGIFRVADNSIAHPESVVVHRTRRRHADIPVAGAARIILNRCEGAGHDDLDGIGAVSQSRQCLGRDVARHEYRRDDNLPEVVEIGRDAAEARRRQRFIHFPDRVGTIGSVHDQFRQHRIVERRDLCSGGDPPVDPCIVGKDDFSQHARRRLEIMSRVFRIQPHLDRSAFGLRQLLKIGRLACGGAHHPLDEIDPEHVFRHGMFDLQPRIDFEEVEFVARAVVDEFDGPRRTIADGDAELFGRFQHPPTRRRGKVRRRRFLDDLLVAALERAIAFAKSRDIAAAVAENLYLDVTRVIDAAFEKHAGILEEVLRQPLHGLVGGCQFIRISAAGEADAAAAGGRLQHHRKAEPHRVDLRLCQARQQARSRHQRHARRFRNLARGVLQPEAPDLIGRGADEGNALRLALLGEVGILRQEAVAGDNGIGAVLFRCGDDEIATQIGLAGAVAWQVDGDIGEFDVRTATVGIGVDRDAADAHVAQRAHDPGGNLAAVGDKNSLEHWHPERPRNLTTGPRAAPGWPHRVATCFQQGSYQPALGGGIAGFLAGSVHYGDITDANVQRGSMMSAVPWLPCIRFRRIAVSLCKPAAARHGVGPYLTAPSAGRSRPGRGPRGRSDISPRRDP